MLGFLRGRPVRRSIFALFALAVPQPAYAHATFGQIDGFWSGAAHVVISPVAVAILIGLTCRIATQAPRSAFMCIAAVIASSGMTAAFFNDAVIGPVAAALIGGLAALAPRHHKYESVPLGVLAGAAVGASVQLDSVGWLACLGVSAAAGWIALFAFEGLVRLEPMSSVPRRVIGSWAAALGVLLVALAVRGTTN